jgi:hypothetical protein
MASDSAAMLQHAAQSSASCRSTRLSTITPTHSNCAGKPSFVLLCLLKKNCSQGCSQGVLLKLFEKQ